MAQALTSLDGHAFSLAGTSQPSAQVSPALGFIGWAPTPLYGGTNELPQTPTTVQRQPVNSATL